MSHLKAIIFDVDGTLAETERDGHRLAFNQTFAEAGLDWDWSIELYGELLTVSGGKERIDYYIKRYHPNGQPPNNLDEWIAKLHQAKTRHYRELLAKGDIPLRPGVKRLITEALGEGVRLAIATTSAFPNAIALLEETLNPHWFEVIAAGDIVPHKKPAPDIYNYALEKLGLTASDCLAIEDSRQGLLAARGVGLTTIITVNNYTKNEDFEGAALVINHLGEPDLSCEAIASTALNSGYITLDLLRHIHQISTGVI
ncbi:MULTISPECIES: HAD family hydrolase [Limnospira]|uniref:Protein CbbY, plasmid n=1 Tax=Limnospira indica PCC 8005 TaxID=376219 RepID=A0A9P1P1G4_9CYAN|nr:HAD family hydrolase [Limnospira indica]CDM95865.1 Protein CbbY, plasmid [Limnospira indica PCC 8005]